MSTSNALICSKIDPSNTFLASGVIALDTHQVKIQSINSSQSSLNVSFNLDKSSKLTNLSWISHNENQLVALCLSKGSILIYSPLTNEVVSEFETPYNLSTSDFYYSDLTKSAWSCDIGGNIYEWNMTSLKLQQTFKISSGLEESESFNRITTILYENNTHLLVGSHSIYLINIKDKQIVKTFPGHVQLVNNIYPVPNDSDLFLTSAKGDRFINLFSVSKSSTKTVFVSQSSVLEVTLSKKDSKSVLAIVNENGNLEIFNNPLSNDFSNFSTNHKKKRRQQGVQSRSSNAFVKLSRPAAEIRSPSDSNLPISAISVNDDSILISWLENYSFFGFESIKWLDESGNLILEEEKIIEKSRNSVSAIEHSAYGHDIAATKHYNEANAIVSDGTNFRDLDNESEEEESLAEKLEKLSTYHKQKSQTQTKKKLGKNSTGTLTIILSQSLKNNDHSLLESVLINRDVKVIQSTIAKLDSSLAIILLDRLSERIQRQSSRFDQLNYWLKWIIIIHGGILSSMPNLNSKLANLHSILIKKANTLPRLFELQGRLNMIQHQNELKKEILNDEFNYGSEEVDTDVEYVEEIDDAELMDEENEDMEIIEDQDDYDESELDQDDDEIDSEDEDASVDEDSGNVKSVMDLDASEDEENYSDLEADTNYKPKNKAL